MDGRSLPCGEGCSGPSGKGMMPSGPRLMSQFPFWLFYPMCCVILAFVNVFCIRSWLGMFIRSYVNMLFIRSWLGKFIKPLVFQFCICLSGQHKKYHGYSSHLSRTVVYHYGQCLVCMDSGSCVSGYLNSGIVCQFCWTASASSKVLTSM